MQKHDDRGITPVISGIAGTLDPQELRQRSEMLWAIRQYFQQHELIEVETPLLRKYAVSDPQLANLLVNPSRFASSRRYLQTSPEAALKALLASGSGSIYQLSKVFRDDPEGHWHKQEFTLLEWYRVGFDLSALMKDIEQLLSELNLSNGKAVVTSYRDAFAEHAQIDPFVADISQLKSVVLEKIDSTFDIHQLQNGDAGDSTARNLLLDLIMSHLVQPRLGHSGFEFLVEFPAAQAALAKTAKDGEKNDIALRAELFYRGIELANAYEELDDVAEFERRYQSDCKIRAALGLPEVDIDAELLEAMQVGLPACSGVALGIDRLFSIYHASAEP